MRAKVKKQVARDRQRAAKKNGDGGKPSVAADARSLAFDYFSNAMARTGWGTRSIPEATSYEMVRLSNNYWLLLTLYRNHWLARRIVDLPAQDMTRAWPKLVSDIPPYDIQEFNRTLKRTYTARSIRRALKWARLYGGAGALIVIDGHEDILDKPLDLDDVNPGTYMGLIPFDRWAGIWPYGQAASDIRKTRPHAWGLPEKYEVTEQEGGVSFSVHASRIIRFCGPEVPTPEFQAQMYWGISQLELVYEELRKKDNASWSILNLLFRANIIARIDPQLDQFLSGLGANQTAQVKLNQVLQAQNEIMSNQSMLVLGKDGRMESVQYSFGGIGEAYAQFQMDTAGAAEIPVTRLFGRTVTGLGQSNDADERYYEESIAQKQDEELGPGLDQLYPVICMSEFGEVPDDLDFKFPSIRVLSEEDKAELVDKAAGPILAAFDSGVLGRKTALQELRQLGDSTNIFTNITDEIIDKAEEEPELPGEDLLGLGPGGESAPGPGKPKSPKQLLEKTGVGDSAPSYRSVNGEIGDKVHELMESRSFSLADEDDGQAIYERHDGDTRVVVRFKDESVEYAVGKSEGKAPRSRKGWEGVQSFASALGDAAFDQFSVRKRIKWHGMDISIEHPRGSVRKGVDAGGMPWRIKLTHDYGYLLKTRGVDGDHVDCFIGPDPLSEVVFVVHTRKAPDFKEYDEDKCMLNFSSEADARAAFFANYSRPEHFGSMDVLPVGRFIDKVLSTKGNPRMIVNPPKVSKEVVSYEAVATGPDKCKACTHFEKPRECELVIGVISPGGWCKLFEQR